MGAVGIGLGHGQFYFRLPALMMLRADGGRKVHEEGKDVARED